MSSPWAEAKLGRARRGFSAVPGGAERPLDGDVVPAGPCSRWALEEAGEEAPWAAGASCNMQNARRSNGEFLPDLSWCDQPMP